MAGIGWQRLWWAGGSVGLGTWECGEVGDADVELEPVSAGRRCGEREADERWAVWLGKRFDPERAWLKAAAVSAPLSAMVRFGKFSM